MIHRSTIRLVSSAAIAALLLTGTANRASADLHGAIGAVILGCASGIVNCNNNRRTTKRSTGISSAQREQNRNVQSALNAFGWNVGYADGVLGRNSRNGISQYEAYMGWPVDGRLTPFERDTLIGSWRRFQAGGGSIYPNMMAREGGRGLLRTAINPQYPSQFGDNVGGTFATAPAAPAPVPAAPVQQAPAAGGTTLALAPLAPLASEEASSLSMSVRCEIVELKTEAAQGVILASNVTDSDQALSEKFCDAVSHSILKSTARMASTGVPEAQLVQACTQITDQVAPLKTALTSETVDGTLQQMRVVNAALGLADASNAKAYGEICTGLGYRRDDADMALAGALVLTGSGQMPFGELIGHHVREGFGVGAKPDSAIEWYVRAISALEQGAEPAFPSSNAGERVSLIRAALAQSPQAGLAPKLPAIVPAATTPLVPLD